MSRHRNNAEWWPVNAYFHYYNGLTAAEWQLAWEEQTNPHIDGPLHAIPVEGRRNGHLTGDLRNYDVDPSELWWTDANRTDF